MEQIQKLLFPGLNKPDDANAVYLHQHLQRTCGQSESHQAIDASMHRRERTRKRLDPYGRSRHLNYSEPLAGSASALHSMRRSHSEGLLASDSASDSASEQAQQQAQQQAQALEQGKQQLKDNLLAVFDVIQSNQDLLTDAERVLCLQRAGDFMQQITFITTMEDGHSLHDSAEKFSVDLMERLKLKQEFNQVKNCDVNYIYNESAVSDLENQFFLLPLEQVRIQVEEMKKQEEEESGKVGYMWYR
eukprot:GHVP01032796.1.p1 GENE.GHVP01032796.1~~GHVP01032796.1.p1  ORF type:complete len:260 (+),score=41.70 GHVP01032796.1:44-781(+)